jgi:hypothetical protein
MTRFAIALLAALAVPAASLADAPPKSAAPPPPSSYAPGPRTQHHVYGSPIEPRQPAAARTPRAKAATPHTKSGTAHAARHHAAKDHQPAPAPPPAAARR